MTKLRQAAKALCLLTFDACLLLCWAWSQEQTSLQRGHVLFETDVESAAALQPLLHDLALAYCSRRRHFSRAAAIGS